MKKVWQYILAGIAVAIGGMLISDIAGDFFNGMDYGSACVLGICMYLCVVIVTCTGIIVTKLDKNAYSEESRDKPYGGNKLMHIQHPQENIIKTYDYNGITVDLVEWSATIWCGKLGYANNNSGEPDVEKIMEDFMSIYVPPNGREDNWDICMSMNYLSHERPSGVMFGFLVAADVQPDCYDIYKVPAAKYMRIRLCEETARALGHEPWTGGVPPYDWIGGQIAPALGCTYGSDTLPIIEYYGFFKPEEGTHEYCYLYVPVKELP